MLKMELKGKDLKNGLFIFILCSRVFWQHVYVTQLCLMLKGTKRGCQIPWNWRYREL